MGGEFKRKGVNMLLGPVVGPLGRVVEGGRNWEGKFEISLVESTGWLISHRLLGRSIPWWRSGP